MLVFNNQQRNGYEEISSYGPMFYRDIKEMDAIYRFAGWTCDLMAADLEKLIAEQFILYMSDETLSRYEKFLEIVRDYTMTLEERRIVVNAKDSSSGKISKTKIQEIVNSFVECDCKVVMEGSEVIVEMMFKDNPDKYMDNIRKLIDSTMPAHIGIVYRGGIDLNIVFAWKNVVSLQRISFGITFAMYSLKTGIFLDGSALLDGSIPLNQTHELFPVSVKNPTGVTHTETFRERLLYLLGVKNTIAIGQNMKLRSGVFTMEAHSVNTITGFQIPISLKSDFSVLIKKNPHYLDGELLLNGSEKLNSYIKKEGL